jgi:signal transduction histidine kinase/CheY-like chemotaxis protein
MDMGASETIERGAFSGDAANNAAPRGWLSPVNLAILLGALIAAALVVVLIFQANASNRLRDAALERERHSYDVMLVTRSAGASMARAEAALGRFATSADRGMGTSYYNNWTDAGAQIAQLEGLVGSDPTEVALVHQLRTLYNGRGQELGLTAQRAYYRQGWPALLLFNNAGHSKLIAQIDRTLSAIQDHESGKLQSRFDQSDAAAIQSNRLGQLLSVTGLVLAAAAGLLAWLALLGLITQRRARAEADAADDRAAWLEQAVTTRTQELSDSNERLQREMVEREAAESRLRQMQKMEAVGQLTGGIAHDFNNMLAVVVGGLDLARRRLETEAEEVGRHIDNAMEGANRAAALTRRLLGFARAEPLLPEAIDPGALIDDMSDLIDRTLGERVIVTTKIAADAWPVWVDPMQLENAIINLAVNARDAMDGAGRLEIAVDNVTLADGEIGQAKAGDHICVAVTDSGCGMTPQVLERVFEPFFTTKEVGKGTGLGMSQIFGFVRQSGGDIAIRSAPGQGTTVSLYLPRGNKAAVPIPAMPAPIQTSIPARPVETRLAGEPVLIVEDDPRVRAATTAAIAELGYCPIACGSGEDALVLLGEHGEINLMITDVVMPGMTGPELGAVVRTRHPGVGILYVTGYAGEAAEGGELEGEAVLRKPFTISALEKAVDDAMHRPRKAHAA